MDPLAERVAGVVMARQVAARFIESLIKKADIPPSIAGDLMNLAEAVEAGEEMAAWKPRRRQRGKPKRTRQKRYRRTKQKSKRQSQRWRKRNKAKTKRYERRRQRAPQRHRLRRADETETMPFWDLEHGSEGEIKSINPAEETLQVEVNGEPKEYGMFPFLDDTVFMSEAGESEFFKVLDEAYDKEPLDEAQAEAMLEGGGESRQARELSVVWMVRDPYPGKTYKGPQWEDNIFKMTLVQFINYLSKVGIRRWNSDNAALHDEKGSAEKDAKGRLKKWEHRFDINL